MERDDASYTGIRGCGVWSAVSLCKSVGGLQRHENCFWMNKWTALCSCNSRLCTNVNSSIQFFWDLTLCQSCVVCDVLKTLHFSKIYGTTHQSTQCHSPEDANSQEYCCENLKSTNVNLFSLQNFIVTKLPWFICHPAATTSAATKTTTTKFNR